MSIIIMLYPQADVQIVPMKRIKVNVLLLKGKRILQSQTVTTGGKNRYSDGFGNGLVKC